MYNNVTAISANNIFYLTSRTLLKYFIRKLEEIAIKTEMEIWDTILHQESSL